MNTKSFVQLSVTLIFVLATILPAQADIQASPLNANGDFLWAKSMGGTSWDYGDSCAADSAGNVYTTGYFQGTADFDPGPGTFNLTAGNADIYVSKLNSSGNFVWAKNMGGENVDMGNSIAVDPGGNIYTTGRFQDTADFDPGPGTFNLTTAAGWEDIFVSKLDSNGNFIWAKSMGGNFNAEGEGIAADSEGNVYTTGKFAGTIDFDPGPGTYNLTTAGTDNIFVSKLDNSGAFVWAKQMGGTSWVDGTSITVDTSNNVYTTGYFEGTVDFDPGPGTFNLTSPAGYKDIFISKLNSSGAFVWAKRMGGTSTDMGRDIAIDIDGNVHITGSFRGTADFDPGPGTFNLTSAGSEADIFVSKLNSNGAFVWAKRLGGTGSDFANSIAVDSSGNIYTTGSFEGTTDFDPGTGTFNLTSEGDFDIFVSSLDRSGGFVWAKRMGGIGQDFGMSVSPVLNDTVYISGSFAETADFDPGPGIYNLTSAGNDDIFIAKLEAVTTNTDVTVGAEQASYFVQPHKVLRKRFAGWNSGPVEIASTDGTPRVASQRVIYGSVSYSEMMGLPFEKLSKEYLFPYYNNVAMQSQLRVSNLGDVPTTITVYLGADPAPIDSYELAVGAAERKSYPNANNGPLRVISTDTNILTTIRVLYGSKSYSELMGYPLEQLSKEYWYPVYDNVNASSQLRVSNVGGGPTTVTILLAGDLLDTVNLDAGEAYRNNFPKNNGPMQVLSTTEPILTTIRLLKGKSLSEYSGLPVEQLAQAFWYPVYDNVSVKSELRVANVGTGDTTITVYAAGKQIGSFDLKAGQSIRKTYSKNTGPLGVMSSAEPIVSSMRLLYTTSTFSSFYEIMGLPASQFSTRYFFPWYNNTAMNSELRFAVP